MGNGDKIGFSVDRGTYKCGGHYEGGPELKEVDMTIQEGIELFRSHQKSQAREKTRESYAYLLRNLETLFGETAVNAICVVETDRASMLPLSERMRNTYNDRSKPRDPRLESGIYHTWGRP